MVRELGKELALGKRTLIVAAFLFPVSVNGQLLVNGSQGVRITDNAQKVSDGEASDVESRTSISATYVSGPGKCNANFSGTVGYSTWLDDSFDGETTGSMGLDSECEIARGLFWDLNNDLREVRQNAAEADTPDNRTRKNLLSTGPRYVWRLGPSDSIALSTRYENTEYDEPQESDSKRYIGSANWDHVFSETLSGGSSVSYTSTDFDTGAEVDVRTLSVNGTKRWAITTFSGSVGISEIETEFGSTAQADQGVVASLNLARQINPSTDSFLRAAREFTDRTSSLDIRFEEFEFNLNESISVETTTLSTGINKRFSDQGSFTASLYASQTDFLQSNTDEEQAGINVQYARPLSGNLTGKTSLSYRHSRFGESNEENNVLSAKVTMDYRLNRELSVVGEVGTERKNSDVPRREYREHWGLVRLNYKFL